MIAVCGALGFMVNATRFSHVLGKGELNRAVRLNRIEVDAPKTAGRFSDFNAPGRDLRCTSFPSTSARFLHTATHSFAPCVFSTAAMAVSPVVLATRP